MCLKNTTTFLCSLWSPPFPTSDGAPPHAANQVRSTSPAPTAPSFAVLPVAPNPVSYTTTFPGMRAWRVKNTIMTIGGIRRRRRGRRQRVRSWWRRARRGAQGGIVVPRLRRVQGVIIWLVRNANMNSAGCASRIIMLSGAKEMRCISRLVHYIRIVCAKPALFLDEHDVSRAWRYRVDREEVMQVPTPSSHYMTHWAGFSFSYFWLLNLL